MVEPEQSLIHGGHSFVQCAFVAQDPLIHSGQLLAFGPIELPRTVGGFTLPFTLPFSIPARTFGGELNLTNEGTESAGMVLELQGPLTSPVIRLEPPEGGTLRLRVLMDLGANDVLTIDTRARSVLLNGTANRRGDVTGDFPLLPPGTSRLRLAAQGSGHLSGSYRHAWW